MAKPPYYLILFLGIIGVALVVLGVSEFIGVGPLNQAMPQYAPNRAITGYDPATSPQLNSQAGIAVTAIGLVLIVIVSLIFVRTKPKREGNTA